MSYITVKRYLDIVFSILGLILLAPFFIVAAISIRLESKGSAIYRQRRLGLHGREFTMYKFRTMHVGADKEGVYDLKGDRRVTKTGRILRLTSLDELPQLINILKGDMSFIGPRPPLTYHPWTFTEYTVPQKKRFMVHPGITGLAQIHGRKGPDWDTRIEYDMEYVDNISFLLDLKIMIITVINVLIMRNNYNCGKTVKPKKDYPYIWLMYITNDAKAAKIAEDNGVEWIMVDLEIIGKEERQGHRDTLISRHTLEDIKKIREAVKKSKLVVRINPIHHGTKKEIDRAVEDGADIIMLPYFKTAKEVKKFILYVNKRAETCLLVETPEAVEHIDEILDIPGIDYAYVGINDLHLGYKRLFMFSLLTDGTVEALCCKFRKKGIPYGFGGLARIGYGLLPAEYVLAEMYRQGSSIAIVSRSFTKAARPGDYEMMEKVFMEGIRQVRSFEDELRRKDYRFFLDNLRIIKEKVAEIEENIIKERGDV